MRSRVEEPPRSTTSPLFVRATGPGTGGIATLILDGAGARTLLRSVFRCKRDIAAAESGALLFGRIVDADGHIIDEAIAAPVGQQESPTGNEQFELSCHGGAGAIEAVEAALSEAGFQPGRGSELLERAHLNGKLSLLALEAWQQLPRAATARHAQALLEFSAFQQRLERLGMDAGLGMRTGLGGWREHLLSGVECEILNAEYTARILATHRIALLGPVNAGKSSLANALAGAQRHLVSAFPGTTLDRIESLLDVRGLSLLLADTAGARATDDPLEQEGQRRADAAARDAALRILVLDGSRPPTDAELDWAAAQASSGPLLLVLTKSDLGTSEAARGLGFLCGSEPLILSALTGAGLDELQAALERALLGAPRDVGAFTARQRAHLEELRRVMGDGETESVRVLDPLRDLIGSRPNRGELERVLRAVETRGA